MSKRDRRPSPPRRSEQAGHDHGWRARWHEVIFEADTPKGKAFDIVLWIAILLSVGAVLLESMAEFQARWGTYLRVAEWTFTAIFTVEYLARLAVVKRPAVYARSFFGIVDLLALMPSYLSLVLVGSQSLLVIRALRLLRVFRVLKLAHFVGEAQILRAALRASARKIIIFVGTVLNLVLIVGSLMYLVEGEAGGFTSIPKAIYWAIVTLTTVGYGDIVPTTALGQFLAATVMIMGYGIIAVPTGIVTVELATASRKPMSTQSCDTCGLEAHDHDARFCKRCGCDLRVPES